VRSKYIDVSAEIASKLTEATLAELMKYQELNELAQLHDEIESLERKLASVDSTPKIEYA
jgi:hypothetical protein